ncbi:MAG TPA: TraO [Erwinia persicina]|nr:TraO [Erwinia persicina]HBT14385.1 TraO [Erwinia persicina]
MATTEKGTDFTKIAVLAGGVIVISIIGGYYVFAPSDVDTASSNLTTSNPSTGGNLGKERTDPNYNRLLQTFNAQHSERADQTGDSFISTLEASNPSDVDVTDKPQAPQYNWKEKQQTQQSKSGSGSNDNGEKAKQQKEQQKAITAVLTQLDKTRTPVAGAQLASAWGDSGQGGSGGQSAGGQNGSGQATGGQSGGAFSSWTQSVYPQQASMGQNTGTANTKGQGKQSKGARLISAYKRIPAIVDNAMDSDDLNSPTTAHVPLGDQKGATFYSNENRLAGAGIRVHFTGMEWNGVECKVDAYSVDAETLKASIASDVNDRWFTHVIVPAVANGIGRTGQLYEDSNSQMILTDNGNAYRSTGTPNGKAIAGTIIGGIGEQTGRVLEQQAARTPFRQVTVDPNKLIGIQFAAPVYESDCGDGILSQGNNAPATQQQQTEPQQLNAVAPQQTQYAPQQPQYAPQPYPQYSDNSYRRGYYR